MGKGRQRESHVKGLLGNSITLSYAPTGQTATVKCSSCEDTSSYTGYCLGQNPNVIHKHFQGKGWQFQKRRNKARCPECVTRNRYSQQNVSSADLPHQYEEEPYVAQPTQESGTKKVVPILQKSVPKKVCTNNSDSQSAPVASERARKAKREALEYLELHFDVETGFYTQGWSDKRIAECVDIAENAVVEIRSEFFGELCSTAEIDEALQRVIELEDQLQERENAIRDLINSELSPIRKELQEVRLQVPALLPKKK